MLLCCYLSFTVLFSSFCLESLKHPSWNDLWGVCRFGWAGRNFHSPWCHGTCAELLSQEEPMAGRRFLRRAAASTVHFHHSVLLLIRRIRKRFEQLSFWSFIQCKAILSRFSVTLALAALPGRPLSLNILCNRALWWSFLVCLFQFSLITLSPFSFSLSLLFSLSSIHFSPSFSLTAAVRQPLFNRIQMS